MLNLKNTKGIIFGSTGLIGSKLAIELTKLGSKLILHGQQKKKLVELDNKIKKLNAKQILLQADLTNLDFYNNLQKLVCSRFDSIDFLINLVGKFSRLSPLTHFSQNDWNELIELNLNSYWRTLRELEPLLKKSKNPKIIFVTNFEISMGKAYHNIFSVSKAAIQSMANTYAEENKKFNIKIKIIDLKKINKGMTSKILKLNDISEKELTKISKKIINKSFNNQNSLYSKV